MSGISNTAQKSGGRGSAHCGSFPAKRSIAAAKSYYSTIFDQPAEAVWALIRDFNNYPLWVDGAGESEIEAGKSGDSVGAVRNVLYRGLRRRQRLVALSDVDRSQTYEFVSEAPLHTRSFQANLRVTPVVDETSRSWSGGQPSTAIWTGSTNAGNFFAMRLRDGCNRCDGIFPAEMSDRFRKLAKLELLDLPGAGLRNFAEDNVTWTFVTRELLAAPLHELVGVRLHTGL